MIRLTTAALALAALGSAAAVLRPAQEEMPQPTQEHAYLLKGVGEWEGTMTMHMPGMPEEGMPCHESVTAVGGFWTASRFECEFMGMPFVGSAVTGYDPDKGKFVGTWVDAASTYLTLMEGEYDEGRNLLIMRYEAPDPMSGEMAAHRIETVNDGETYTSHFFMGPGEGARTMTITMKRVKSKGGK